VTRRSFWSGQRAQGASSVMGNDDDAAVGAEQSSEERGRTGEGTKLSG
jgi:hypothetical protein